MVRRYRDVCTQKEQHFEFISSLGNVQILWWALFHPTQPIPNLVNCRISCLEITLKPRDPFRGAAEGSDF